MARPRRRNSRAASDASKARAAAKALYSPNECPATSTAMSSIRRPPSRSSTRSTASDIAIRAGWAFWVRVSSSAGPSNISLDRLCLRVSSTSSNTSRAGAKAAARSRPMPTAWLPWPGKTKARTGMGAVSLRVARRLGGAAI